MLIGAFVLFAIIRIDRVNLIRGLGDDCVCEEASSTDLNFVWQDSGIQFALREKSSMAANRCSLGWNGDFPLSGGKRSVSK